MYILYAKRVLQKGPRICRHINYTVCRGSSVPFYIVTYYDKICARRDKSPKIRNITSKNRKKKNIKIGEKPLTIGTKPLQEGPKPKK